MSDIVDDAAERLERAPARRVPSAEFVLRREAAMVLKPLNDRLGPWQERAVHLAALKRRADACGRSEPRFADEAAAYLAEIEATKGRLHEILQAHPQLADHGRVLDLRRALDNVWRTFREMTASR